MRARVCACVCVCVCTNVYKLVHACKRVDVYLCVAAHTAVTTRNHSVCGRVLSGWNLTVDNGGMWQSCWWGTDNSNNQHVSPPSGNLIHQDSDSNTRPRQAGRRRDERGDVTASVDMVSGHCCCCPLGLAQRPCSVFQRPCQQERHCTCCIIHVHNVHVQPHGQPLHPLEVQQQRLPTPWRGTQVDKSTASKNNTHSVQTDPS